MGMERIAYIKYGDVVSEYLQVQSQPAEDGDLGYLSRVCELGKTLSMLLLSFDRPTKTLKNRNIEAYVFNSKDKNRTIDKITTNLFKSYKTLQLLLSYKPDFILCGVLNYSLWGAVLAAKLIHRPIIFSSHHSFSTKNSLLNKGLNFFNRSAIKNCDGVLCNGPYLKNEMLQAGVDSHKIVEFLPTFNELIKTARNVINFQFSQPYILFAGRIETEKGVYDLLSAFKKVFLTTCKNITLVYAGDGAELRNLKKIVEDSNLTEKVIFIGRVPYNNLGGLIKKSLFVVIPSKSTMCEGICKIALEAQILGKPVIAPNYSVFPYIIDHGRNGLLFKTDSQKDLSKKIVELLYNKKLYQFIETGAKCTGKRFERIDMSFSEAIITSLNSLFRTKYNKSDGGSN